MIRSGAVPAVRRLVTLLVLVAMVLSGCSLQTTGGKKGDLDLSGRFDDIQHLVVGHSVRVADVPVGTVTGIELDGYDAVVEMSIMDDRTIPVGTVASISATSLLGENYVRLRFPDEPFTDFHESGDELATSSADASFEELTVQLLSVLRAIEGRDVADIVDAGAVAIGGRGAELGELFVRLDELGDSLVGQSEDLGAAIDSFAALGADLVGDVDAIGESVERAADATGTLASQGERVVLAVEELADLARALDDNVLAPHRDQLQRVLDQLTPVARTLADEADALIAGLDALRDANPLVPRIVGDHEAYTYGIFDTFYAPDGSGPYGPGGGAPAVFPQGAGAVRALLRPPPGGAP